MADANIIQLTNVRIAFPKLWTPEPFPGGKDPTKYYSAAFIMDPDDPQVAAVKALIAKVVQEKYPKEHAIIVKGMYANNKVPIHDGDAKANFEGYAGMVYVSARSKTRPLVIHRDRSPVDEESGIIFSGCYVNASFGFFTYDKGSKGVGAGLRGVQYWAEGDRFSGGGAAGEDEFAKDEIAVPNGGEDDPLMR
jgi:hypothetical protein